MVGTMRRLTLMGTVDKHWSLRLVWSIASFVWPLWCYLTISFLQGTAICSITGKLYTLKLGILVHKKKIYWKGTRWNNILHVYCMLDCWYDISNFTGNKHSKVIYIAWWYIILKKISLISVKLIPDRKLHQEKWILGCFLWSTCMNVVCKEFIFEWSVFQKLWSFLLN